VTAVYQYWAFQMKIESDIPLQLPPFVAQTHSSTHPDSISIMYGKVHINGVLDHKVGSLEYGTSLNDPSEILLHIPNLADFSIGQDALIKVQPTANADEKIVAQFIIGIALMFLVKRQPIITLHGSAVSIDSNAVVFLGAQGSGKSSTAMAMTLQGAKMLCDDAVPIGLADRDGIPQPVVYPGIPRPKLLPDAYRDMIGDTSEAMHLFDGVDKYQIPIESETAATPLHLVYLLIPTEGLKYIEYEELKGFEKIAKILPHLSVLQGVEAIQDSYSQAVNMFRNARVWEIRRPNENSTIDQVVEVVQSIMDASH